MSVDLKTPNGRLFVLRKINNELAREVFDRIFEGNGWTATRRKEPTLYLRLKTLDVSAVEAACGVSIKVDIRTGASSPLGLVVTDRNGTTLEVDWDPYIDEFDYENSTDDGHDGKDVGDE